MWDICLVLTIISLSVDVPGTAGPCHLFKFSTAACALELRDRSAGLRIQVISGLLPMIIKVNV